MSPPLGRILNFNLGVLGHVDSGKTSLARALSTVASTAAFDKNPQSKERGITLDLGFSSFSIPVPSHIQEAGYDRLQITLVDCPGHASLLKTIIGGAQIINLMMLVIDVTKGMQTQTAECLVIGQITCDRMIIVLNKTDMLAADKRPALVERMTKRLRATLLNTKFSEADIVAVAAQPGGPDSGLPAQGLDDLMSAIGRQCFVPSLAGVADAPVLFAVDHCFAIRGQGTVMTGTVLQGTIRVGDAIEIPAVAAAKKVKSIQMFRVGVDRIGPGDRAGVCVTQFEPGLLERGLVCSPGAVPVAFCALVDLQAIPYYKGEVRSKAKFHISLGHETVMARITIFSRPRNNGGGGGRQNEIGFNFDQEYKYEECHTSADPTNKDLDKFVLLEFERAVAVVPGCIVIGSKLDSDINANLCRLAFHGRARWQSADKHYARSELPKLKIYKDKAREGTAERAANEFEVIVRDMFKKETSLDLFTGLRVGLSSGETGVIEGTFGQSGKVKVRVMAGLSPATWAALSGKKKKGEVVPDPAVSSSGSEPIRVVLKFKRYIFDPKKQMIQT